MALSVMLSGAAQLVDFVTPSHAISALGRYFTVLVHVPQKSL